jgi:hypothetical protein
MEVDLSAACSCKSEQVERVNIERSPVAPGARTTRTFAQLLWWNRDGPADCFGEAQADLRFDMSANGAQAFCL